jgi:phage antirepressor YoqD-like protein
MNNNLMVIESSNVLTMSSIEIAELTGKRHDNVMVDIVKMLKDLEIHAPDFTGTYKTARGNEYKCYNLPKRETLILVSGYSVTMRARIIDRWQEIEEKQTPATPKTYIEALEKLLESEKEKLALKEELKAAEPKVEFVNNYVDAKGNKTSRGLVKMLNVNEREFRNWLRDSKIMYRLDCVWMPYSKYLQKGYFEAKVVETNGRAFFASFFTPKGEVWITEKWNKRNAVAKA